MNVIEKKIKKMGIGDWGLGPITKNQNPKTPNPEKIKK